MNENFYDNCNKYCDSILHNTNTCFLNEVKLPCNKCPTGPRELRGPSGPTGTTGATGAMGPVGTTGPTGRQPRG